MFASLSSIYKPMIKFYYLSKDYEKIIKKANVDLFQDLSFQKKVYQIIAKVKESGDEAIKHYSEKFDRVALKEIRVPLDDIKNATVSADLEEALNTAIANISEFHKKQSLKNITFQGKFKESLRQVITPIEKAGVYVPGGKGGMTPLVSTLLMNVIPAQIAGVKKICVCTPPQKNEQISSVLLYAAKLLGIENIFKIGGSQAIAALAYGTEAVPACDIIVGPGNEYVTYAKKLVFGDVMIDGLNGNSEIVILSDGSERESYLTADLLSQAEHAGNELVLLFTHDEGHGRKISDEIKKQISTLPRKAEIISSLEKRGGIVIVDDWEKAFSLVNEIAPEHLELHLKNHQAALKKINNAGTIFVGKYSSEPIGDYICGTNHVLPTNQTARFSSPLGVYTFLKRTNVIHYNKEAFNHYKPMAIRLAMSEALSAHAEALKIRD